MVRALASFVSVALLLSSGCSERESAETRPAPPPEPSAAAPAQPTEVELVAWMEAHYGATIRAHDALLQGDLSAFRARLADASELESPPAMPDAWAPLLERFRASAGEAAGATSLGEAAGVMAGVVLSCGQCHSALGHGPVYPAPAPEDGIGELQDAMLEHKWAAERLWEGVTGPWDVAWQRGAAALVRTRVFGDTPIELAGDLLLREQALNALGEEALRTSDHGERAVLYGRLLASCGDCHDAFGARFD